MRKLFAAISVASGLLLVEGASAQSAPIQVHTAPQQDAGVYSGRLKVPYPTPYELATEQEVRKLIEHMHAYVVTAAPVKPIDAGTGAAADMAKLPKFVGFARTDLLILTYEWGVTYAGMLRMAEVTGDTRYRDYVNERVTAIGTLAAHAKKNLPAGTDRGNFPTSQHGMTMRGILFPGRLDDAGAMCAALIKSELAGLGDKKLRPWIDNWVDWVANKQFRLADRTLARNRPLPNTLWLDDLYMSVPCLAQAGRLTGDARHTDDAVRQLLQFSERMFVKDRGLYMHAWAEEMDPHPVFHWARANGWAIMAMVELLSVLPENHQDRPKLLEIYRAHAAGLLARQGHAGLWHQLLDRSESYEETSASAMFVFGIARGINKGWLDPKAFGPAVSLGWNAVAKMVNAKGQVESVCVGTGVGWDPMFYMYRPVHVLAAHGYGPVLLAAAEFIEMRKKLPDIGLHDGGMQFGKALEN